uniref:Glycosyl transferase, family 2 n=1 Tax=Paulinella chromatophora TaxID=39717 RepID=B1X4K5_PAUCH|nr:Glycosyl transferase, family 2 [Paulinella chromatophora]ACB42874.1 Glycosyl transferase, family 2 [Paulinella chromatophora]|eukprot:gb/GEZN01007732.1/.p1 GENE.gb/GEZN01007732.1/~~gb/GEZN01007732.1/.p1  ORF type:complete len:444 (+),score=-20.22 gb/GEZN01007732.1/:163-1494(+)
MVATGTSTYRRRSNAALFLVFCSWGGIAPHWIEGPRRFIPVILLTLFLCGYSLYIVLLRLWPKYRQPTISNYDTISEEFLPSVDLIIAARDEETVISQLIERLNNLQYPSDRLKLWVVNDGSEDHTPYLLYSLQKDFPKLQIIHRARTSGGGKSGALNTVFDRLRGEWFMVLDADAQLHFDVLKRLITFAINGDWSAVQLRKAVSNVTVNFLTRAQAMEMALDATIQEGRLNIGGVVELRGNGQLLKRKAVEICGGFNEATVTDDLDLTFRFLLANEPIGVLWDPPVQEEAVLTISALWRQRQRWAEGGLQRFFDYGEGLMSSRLSLLQKCDLTSFFLIQYALPVFALVDLITALLTYTLPVYWPLLIVVLGLSGVTINYSCHQSSEGPPLPNPSLMNISLGVIYLVHWFLVIPWVALRMAFWPKQFVWDKTLHYGGDSFASE